MKKVLRRLFSASVAIRMSESIPTSKFSSPPSIAHVQRHKQWVEQLVNLDRDKDGASWKEHTVDLDHTGIPLKIQTYANQHSLKPTAQEVALQTSIQSLPGAGMAGAPDEANLLCLLLEMMDAKTVVEVGVFRGTTTLAFASCLQRLDQKRPGATRRVIGLDVSSDYAEIGQTYWKKAGVDHLVDLRIGNAKTSLSSLLEEDGYGENSVDLCFIDADKGSYDIYYEKCLRLTKSGGLIVVDNTIWGGFVTLSDELLNDLGKAAPDYESTDASVAATLARRAKDTIAIKALSKKIFDDDRIERVSFLTIADGVTICRKK